MQPFEYERAEDIGSAVASLRRDRSAKVLAGGTNLVDLMKQGVERPRRLVDVNRLKLAAIEELPGGGLRLGALARNAETASHPLVRQRYPMLARAILSGASPMLRHRFMGLSPNSWSSSKGRSRTRTARVAARR